MAAKCVPETEVGVPSLGKATANEGDLVRCSAPSG